MLKIPVIAVAKETGKNQKCVIYIVRALAQRELAIRLAGEEREYHFITLS